MRFNRIPMLFFLLVSMLFIGSELFAQVSKDTLRVQSGYMLILRDSVIAPQTDSMVVIPCGIEYKIKKNPHYKSQSFYDSLKSKSDKNQMYSELYGLMIVNRRSAKKDTNDNVKAENEFLPYQGMNIREIYVRKVDILAGDVRDTNLTAHKGLPKFLNETHTNTLEKIIRSNLLIHKGDTIDANRMADNEHIIRSLNYIDDVRIIVVPIDEYNADVVVITKDKFPIALGFSYSSIEVFSLDFKHKNFLGTGQEIRDRVLINTKYDPIIGNRLDYGVSNLFKTFISFNARYNETPTNTTINFRLNRDFMTPETKYAGGLEYLFLRDTKGLTYPIPDTIPNTLKDTSIAYNFSCHIENFWVGRSFLLDLHDRKNIIVAGKYNRIQYVNRPIVSKDTNQAFENASLILGNVTYIKRQIVKTRYLLGFGRTEDVNAGLVISLTSGYYLSDIHDLFYASIKVGYGHAFKKGGYFGGRFEYGSFFYKKNSILGVTSSEILMYTPLIKIKQSCMRVGGRIIYIDGINRYKYESINLSNDVPHIPSSGTKGTSKTVIKFEAIYFSNLYLYGFQFAPYVMGAVGKIRSKDPDFYDGDLYSGVGFGIRIFNNSLIFPIFDISFMYYPNNVTGVKAYRIDFTDSEPRVFNNVSVGEPYIVPY